MEVELQDIKSLLALNFFIHERLYRHSHDGYISRTEALITIRRSHNIPKDECPIVFRSLEILRLIKRDGKYFKVKEPKKSREELLLDFKKKLKMV